MTKPNSDLKGVKSSTLMSDLFYEESNRVVVMLMKTSFYLPVDLLNSSRVTVLPVEVITGEEFYRKYYGIQRPSVHCDVSPDLMCLARYVGVSIRWFENNTHEPFTVCKIWYGQPPKKGKV